MIQIFSNNVSTTLGADLSNSATSLTLASASGFPTPTADQYFLITITQGVGTETSHEVIRVTGRSGTNLTGLVRGQEGTAAAAWVTGDKVEMRLTAGSLEGLRVDTVPIEHSLMQLYLMSAVTSGIATNSITNGMFDAFNAGTTLASSSGGTYDSVNKLWWNSSATSTTLTASMLSISGGLALWGASIGTLIDGTLSQNNGVYFTGAGNGRIIINYGSPVTLSSIGVYGYGADGSGTWKIQYSDNGSTWTDTGKTVVTAASSWVDNATISSGSHQYWCLLAQYSGSSTGGIVEIRATAGSNPAQMTLVSQAMTPAPLVAPSKLDIQVWWKPIDASTLNTDFIAEGTRDGGTTWTTGTLTDSGIDPISGFNLLKTSINLDGQPSGTTVQYRLRTANSKSQQIKGVALMYS